MAAKPVKVAFLADTADLRTNLAKAETAMDSAAAEAKTAGQKMDAAFDGTAEGADELASKGAQAAGALSGLGDLVGGKLGAAMQTGGIAMQAAADSGDLLNAAMENSIVSSIRAKAATAAKTVVDKAQTAATKAQTIAQRALNLAMRANPIGLIITALVLLAAGLVIAYKKSETFRRIVNKAFDIVKRVAESVAKFFTDKIPAAFRKVSDAAGRAKDWLSRNWPKILAVLTGPFGLAVYAIAKNWGRIKDAAGAAKDWIVGKFDALVSFVKGLPGRIGRAARGAFDGLKDAFRSSINWIIDGWNSLSFTLPEVDTHIPGVGKVGGWSISTPDIPRLARGGVVIAGDNPSGIEAVVPLERWGEFGLGGARTYNITLQVPVGASSEDIGRTLVRHIDAYERAGGRRRA